MLLQPDILGLIAKNGYDVRAPMLGVSKRWNAAAKLYPRATYMDIVTPSTKVYVRSGFYDKDWNRALREAERDHVIFDLPTPEECIEDFVEVHSVHTTKERLQMILSLRSSTFDQLAIKPARSTSVYHLYHTRTAMRIAMQHSDGVWGLLQRRYKDEHQIRHRVVLQPCAKRKAAAEYVARGLQGGPLAHLPADAQRAIMRIASRYYGVQP